MLARRVKRIFAFAVLLLFISFLASVYFVMNHIDHEHDRGDLRDIAHDGCSVCIQIGFISDLLKIFAAADFIILSILALLINLIFYNAAVRKTGFFTPVHLKVRINS